MKRDFYTATMSALIVAVLSVTFFGLATMASNGCQDWAGRNEPDHYQVVGTLECPLEEGGK